MSVDVTSPYCGCGCRPAGCEPGCACKECQPGPGIDHLRHHNARSRRHSARLMELLRAESLTPYQERELDSLLTRATYF